MTVRDSKDGKRAEAAVAEQADRLSRLSRRLMDAEEQERRKINRELHDRIGQGLSTLSLSLNIMRSRLMEDPLTEIASRLEAAQNLLEGITAQVRDIMAELHPPALNDYGLMAAIRTHIESVARTTQLRVLLTGLEPQPRLPASKELALFRIAQEAIANAAKHSRADQVEVSLQTTPRTVRLTVSDNGQGCIPEVGHSARWGLIIMRERAQAIDARFDLRSSPGTGTRVVVALDREAP